MIVNKKVTNLEITAFSDYKAFVRAEIAQNCEARGYQSQLAKAAGCSSSFFSQVLNSNVHFTPDHGAGLANFWRLPELDADYFLALIHEARAGSIALKRMIEKTKQSVREKKLNLSRRFQAPRLSKSESELLYYSGWPWAAIHVLLSVPKYRSVSTISQRLGIPPELTQKHLYQLEKMGLAKQDRHQWRILESNVHLPKESPVAPLHHANWRQKALENARNGDSEAIHYTAIHGLSFADMDKIRHLILRTIEESRAVVGPSKEEDVACLTVDFFKV